MENGARPKSTAHAFRHLVRHRYGFDLKADKVIENLDRIREAFPSFVDAVVRLEKTMAAEDTDDGDGTAGAPGR
jgi:uncharacterized protein YutE (UPF0331/DUF86 family)